jgi:hypothetical protein
VDRIIGYALCLTSLDGMSSLRSFGFFEIALYLQPIRKMQVRIGRIIHRFSAHITMEIEDSWADVNCIVENIIVKGVAC